MKIYSTFKKKTGQTDWLEWPSNNIITCPTSEPWNLLGQFQKGLVGYRWKSFFPPNISSNSSVILGISFLSRNKAEYDSQFQCFCRLCLFITTDPSPTIIKGLKLSTNARFLFFSARKSHDSSAWTTQVNKTCPINNCYATCLHSSAYTQIKPRNSPQNRVSLNLCVDPQLAREVVN